MRTAMLSILALTLLCGCAATTADPGDDIIDEAEAESVETVGIFVGQP